jgi:RNA polymerase sigma-70 factor (ECF subfamily)
MDNAASSYRRYLDGDESAFDSILQELFDPLVFFIDRIVGNTAAAEDIAMDAFADLIVHRHRYNFKVTLKTYLFMIGRSRGLNYMKRQAKFPSVPLEDAAHLTADRTLLEEKLLRDERKRIVSEALSALPEDMRTAVHLVYFEELSYSEAAKIMKKNPKQIDNLLYRAKNALRAAIGKEGTLLL